MAEEIVVRVDYAEGLKKLIDGTKQVPLNEAQKSKIEKSERGAELALKSNDLTTFQKHFNEIVSVFKDAAAASGLLSGELKRLTDDLEAISKTINKLQDSKSLLEGKLTTNDKGQRVFTKEAADEFVKTNEAAQKAKDSEGKTLNHDQLIAKYDEISRYLQQNALALTKIKNTDATALGMKDINAVKAVIRAVNAEQKAVTQTDREIQNTNKDITEKQNAQLDLTTQINNLNTAATTTAEGIEKLYKEITNLAKAVNEQLTSDRNNNQNQGPKTPAATPKTTVEELNQVAPGKNNELQRAFKQFSLYAIAVRSLKKALGEAVQTVKELDKYLTEQAMVTGKTREETYALVGQYQELALACGATTKEIAQVSTEYMKQGKSTADALVLTEAAVKAAKVARVSVGDSVNYLTTALNGFRLEAAEAMRVSDIFASVAAASATDYDELAIALSKVASQANLAGMSIEYTTALLTKGLETTREAPETMGTALKTIIARMREMSDYGETLDDGMDINNVESQLQYVGISLRNAQGELLSTEAVLDELGRKWDDLNKNQQAAIAKALAGTRQQSRLIAMMDDYERVIELQEIAERSTGATSAQAGVYLEGIEASLNKIQVAWEQIVMAVTNSEVIIAVLEGVSNMLEFIGGLLSTDGGMITFLTMALSIGGLILINKIAQHETQKALNRATLQEHKTLLQNRILEKQKYLSALKIAKKKVHELRTEKGMTEEMARQQLLDEDPTNDIVANQILNQMAQDKVSLAEQEAALDHEIRATDAEIRLLTAQQVQDSIAIAQNGAGFASALGSVLQVLTPIISIMTLILTIQKAINAAKAKEKINTANVNKEEKKGLLTKLKSLFASTVKEGSKGGGIPGLIAAIAIATAMVAALGFGIAVAAGAFNQTSAAEKASEEVNSLSSEIYNLTKTADALADVTSKFDDLDNKVLKTNKDLEEMDSLLQTAGDSLSSEEDALYNQETYKNLQDNASRRRYLELAEEYSRNEANKKRQEQLDIINRLDGKSKLELLDDNTTNSKFLESQSAVRAIVNNEIYENIDALKELGIYTDEELSATEKLTVAFMEETKALEALDYANNPQAVADLVSELVNLEATSIFGDESNSISERVKAFRDIQNALSDDKEALAALNKAYSEWDTFARMNDDILLFIENTGLTIDQINELYAGYEKLNKLGLDITKESYHATMNNVLSDLEDDLSNFDVVMERYFGHLRDDMVGTAEEIEEAWNTMISVIGDQFAVGMLDMGQNLEAFQKSINNFYDVAANWNSKTESERMEFLSDNADLFSGKGGAELLSAFESGQYDLIEAALSKQMAERTAEQLEQVRRTLHVEEQRVGDDRNEAYIKALEDYEKYLMDGNNLYKASLELRLEQEKNQLSEYKNFLSAQQDALSESLEKRKEAYEKYFESINQEQETENFEEEAERLMANISKLSSSTSADAMQKRAELEQELKDLEQERLETLREQAQDAVIEDIDDQINEINDKFDKLLESNQALLIAMTNDLNNPSEFLSELIGNKIASGVTELELEQYLQDLEGIYGSLIGADAFDQIDVREENGSLVLNVNGQDIEINESDQQAVYAAVMKALQQIGIR